MTTGEKIRAARKQAGLTQAALGYKCNMPDSQIRQYESGKYIPKPETLQRIANALEIPIDQLFVWEKAESGLKLLQDTKDDILNTLPATVELGKKILEDSNIEILLSSYNSLNRDGKKEAIKRISELTEIQRYTTKTKK